MEFECDGELTLPDTNPYSPKNLANAVVDVVDDAINDPDAYLDDVQDNLDIVGMVPIVGEVADGMNVVISITRGNWARAGMSAVAFVPGLGNATQGVRLGRRQLAAGGGGGQRSQAVLYCAIDLVDS